MKRLSQDLTSADLGRSWSGLARTVKVEKAEDPPVLGPSLKQLKVTKTCVACQYEIKQEDAAMSCDKCDEGPLHKACLQQHRCPTGASVSGGEVGFGDFRLAPKLPPPPALLPDSPDANDDAKDANGSRPHLLRYASGAMDEKGIEGPESPKKGPQVPKSLSHEALVLEHFRLKSGMMASDSLDDDTAEVIKSAENQGEMDGEAAFQKFRLEQPEVNNYDRGNATRLHDVIHDNAAFEKALEQFKEDSRRGWWSSKAALMNLQAYPTTPQSVDVMGTLLKIGKYRSAALYFSAAKQMHIEQGHVWDNRLDQAVKSALRSCLRGIGPDKKCPSFDLTKVCDMKPVEPCSGGPRFPKETIIVFAHFACREVKASVRLRKDILLIRRAMAV